MFGLIGRKLGHSFSPPIHRELCDYEYRLFEMEEEDVGTFLKVNPFEGINVTIPYKKTVMPFLDKISETALKIGSVNTVKRMPDGTLSGDNTDYYGFSYTITNNNVAVKGKKCIILGSGGASLTAIAVLRDMEAKSITVISRNGENNYENISLHYDAEIIVNTTPVGMYPDCGKAPISLKSFTKCEFVFDLIYNPAKTELLLEAEALGIPHANGLLMLVAQAKKACEIFTDSKINDSRINEITAKLSRNMLNIVLIGMPGSGKSTLGGILSNLLGREFFDTDDEIIKKCNRPIPDIFRDNGEEYFRNIEEECVFECGRRSKTVIATGGGAILRQKNIDSLRQNGIIVFLNRTTNELATDGRPLSASAEKVKKLYDERLPIYKKCADIEVCVNDSPLQLANKIIKELSL